MKVRHRLLMPALLLQTVIISLLATTDIAVAADNHISIIDYRKHEALLSLNVVAPSTTKPKLYLNAGGILSELQRFTQVGEHNLSIYLPCDEFNYGDSIYYKADDITLPLSLDPIVCSDIHRAKQPKIIYQENQCFIQPNGTTLWRIANLLSMKNGYSVYQNLYAVFFKNRTNFIGEDIFKLTDDFLHCPSEELISSIDKKHAIEMYREAQQFLLANTMPTRGTPSKAGSTPATVTDEQPDSFVMAIEATPPKTDLDKIPDKLAAGDNSRSRKLHNDDPLPKASEQHSHSEKVIHNNNRAFVYNENGICYIEPRGKTLWRIGLTLSEKNGYSIHQNMYVVYQKNPSAFPTKEVSYMLNQKLDCPDAAELSRITPAHARKLLLPSLK
ncbi:hypothetical protein [Aeromonas veronii]|uniref:hypothetical protein n=1 Tax=Aeromonas veronii TaxID=654 RepID=UPI002714E380|nr:hypothetical protein [Aeromonas veronii]WLD19806.1 hypothetical protein O1Q77_16785 [Aeromonas veronii]